MQYKIHHILAKILFVCIFSGVILIFGHQPAVAQVSSSQTKNLQIKENGDMEVDHRIELLIDSDEVVSNYRVEVPFSDIEQITAYQSGRQVNTQLRGSRITVDFFQEVRPRDEVTVRLKYKVNDALENNFGLISVFVPKVATTEKLTEITTNINYPKSFPELSFNSTGIEPDGNTLTLTNNESIKLIWGEQWGLVISDGDSNILGGADGSSQLLNIVPDAPGQSVAYSGLDGNVSIFTEVNGNVWAKLDPTSEEDFNYEAFISRSPSNLDPDSFIAHKYTNIEVPEELASGWDEDVPQEQQVADIYEYISGNYAINSRTLDSQAELENISQVKEEELSLTSLQVAHLVAGYLNDLSIEHRIDYGYFYGVTWPNFNEEFPHAWVEAKVDGEIQVIDPYLEMATGLDVSDAGDLGRVRFGVWDMSQSADAALGMAGSGVKLRPGTVQDAKVLGLDDPASNESVASGIQAEGLSFTIDNPTSAYTASPYQLTLNITNPTNRIITLGRVVWDQNQLAADSFNLNDRLSQAVPPGSSISVVIEGIANNSLFKEGDETHQVTLIPQNSDFSSVTESYTISYVLNSNLLLLVFVLLLIMVAGLASYLIQMNAREKLIENYQGQ